MFDLNKEAPVVPSLPQNANTKEAEERAFDLSIARTTYNYTRTYLEHVPLSADVPKDEEFSAAYKVKVVEALVPLVGNFGKVVSDLWEKDLKDNWSDDDKAGEQADSSASGSFYDRLKDTVTDAIEDTVDAIQGLRGTARDIKHIVDGLNEVVEEAKEDGATAFLKSTLFYTLSESCNGSYLEAKSEQDYEKLFDFIALPKMLTIEQQEWMTGDEKPCLQDWFFAHLQTDGFNTTMLQGVRMDDSEAKDAAVLSELLRKFPMTDKILQDVLGDPGMTLIHAVQQKRLFVVDYAAFAGAKTNKVHGKQRYIAAAMALFYWNPTPPKGYPPGEGALQPVAIQLDQQFDAEKTPIYTPNNCSDANDADLMKWKVAKYVVNVLCAIQHESVAHLGSCHLTIDPIVVCTNRQLSAQHPLARLLKPHFRFTIQINNSAIHSLIIPRGVVATNVGPAIESTLALVAEARDNWYFDENSPECLFKDRGVDCDALPKFSFRDDTLLLWQAIKPFVAGYLGSYYKNDQDVIDDTELQAWVSELVKPLYAGFKGMNGLIMTGDDDAPAKICSLNYLIEVVSQIIYIAGPKHASVNYAQYPLMSYMPSVAGTIYAAMPTRSEQLKTPQDCLKWYPPLDVGLYTFSFEYLLSNVQFDTFGHYPLEHFAESKVHQCVLELQEQLDIIEAQIEQRNESRAFPYVFQLPSKIPNSISI